MTIKELHQKWLEAEIDDPIKILDYCVDDVEFFPEGTSSIKGKKAVGDWIKNSHQNSSLKEIDVSDLNIKELGALATLTANFETTFEDPVREGRNLKGKHLWQLKRINGDWKVEKLSWEIFGSKNEI